MSVNDGLTAEYLEIPGYVETHEKQSSDPFYMRLHKRTIPSDARWTWARRRDYVLFCHMVTDRFPLPEQVLEAFPTLRVFAARTRPASADRKRAQERQLARDEAETIRVGGKVRHELSNAGAEESRG